MINKILYATDFSEAAENGLPHAVTLAIIFEAKLILFHGQILLEDDPSNPLYHFPDKETLYKKAEEISLELLKKRGEKIKEIEFETLMRRDISADKAILSAIEETKADLAVLGTSGKRGILRFFLGSTTLNLLKYAEIPIYVVPPNVKAPYKDTPYKEILVCMDFSPSSMEALKLATAFKEKTKGKIHLLHIVEEKEREVKIKLKEMERAFNVDKIKILKGRVEKEVIKYAREESIDLIFLGNRLSREEEFFLLGSKVERIILNSPAPCIVTKIT